VAAVGAVGAGIGGGLADDGLDAADPEPTGPVNISLPIQYPARAGLPQLGAAPGPLAAIWVDPGEGIGTPQVVGLVAESGRFGTLPIDVTAGLDLRSPHDPGIALSPDGRRIAYESPRIAADTPSDEVIVHDLVSGEEELLAMEETGLWAYDWLDATHLYGSAGTTDTNGWVWEPGTAPERADLGAYPDQPYLGYGWPYAGKELMIPGHGQRRCASPPLLLDASRDDQSPFEVPVLCDVSGVVGSEIVLGHWNPEHRAGDTNAPTYPSGTVVALDIDGADRPYLDPALRGRGADDAFDDPARRRVVVAAGAPHRASFATGLIGEALEAAGGGP